jgi:hypothetical protein
LGCDGPRVSGVCFCHVFFIHLYSHMMDDITRR